MTMCTETTPDEKKQTTTTSARPGTAGRIDYDKWNQVTNDLVDETEKEEQEALAASKAALGLDGKYAVSQADAEERQKQKEVLKAKEMLEKYQQRESAIVEGLKGLLGPPPATSTASESEQKDISEEEKSAEPRMIRVTRDMVDAGKRVVKLEDTSGASRNDMIVLTSDLSALESKMRANAMQPVKTYADDAENDVQQQQDTTRTIYGVIKAFISNVHNCTILIKCKIISGTIEMSHCSNVTVRIEKEATVATIQADLCEDIAIEFRDAPSGKNSPLPGQPRIYWGQDKEDRIFHAGVKNMNVRILRDGFVETERLCDFMQDGAKAVGNATEKEYQFVTSVVNEELVTEAVIREGSTTGENVRAMTKREIDELKVKKEKAAAMAINMAENMIKFKEKTPEGYKVVKSLPKKDTPEVVTATDDDEIEEVFAGITKDEIDAIVGECEKNKARGNEAFGSGEYAQAILLYTLALEKAHELPDANETNREAEKQLFVRDLTLSCPQ